MFRESRKNWIENRIVYILLLSCIFGCSPNDEGNVKRADLIGTWATWNAGTHEDDWNALLKMDKDPGNKYSESYHKDGSLSIQNEVNGQPVLLKGTWQLKGQKIIMEYEYNGRSNQLEHTIVSLQDSVLLIEDSVEGHSVLKVRGILKKVE